jgi:RimJ/RimL family protein N-acetyltransferase
LEKPMITIATNRLLLRPLEAADLDGLVVAINHFEVIRNTARIPFPYGRTDAEDYLALTRKAGPSQLFLSIALKDDPSRIAGGISAEGGERDSELGYWITPALWGKGFATEAARAMVSHVFQYTEYDEMVAGYRIGNEASRRILVRLGFAPTHEDMIESRGLGYLVPVMRMALTRARWERAGGQR